MPVTRVERTRYALTDPRVSILGFKRTIPSAHRFGGTAVPGGEHGVTNSLREEQLRNSPVAALSTKH